MITDTPERSLAAMLCSACELLAAVAEQTDIKVTVCHTGRMQLYDYGSEEFEADQMEPHRASETLKSALEARPDGWVCPRPNKWQSIATAPKDGTKILAYERIQETDKILSTAEWPAHDKIMVAWWDVTTRTKKVPVGDGLFREAEEIDFEGWIDGWDRWIPMSCNPSHWQPLPSPPPNHTQPEP